ncbi:hypothetical protein [uncultured Brevundimonas sp.]|uniref:hypothetical protein n=1 Tax=uncultured Brevundimonas sp. TaxID=213418 RepID=UPI0030EBC1FA
MVTLLSGAILSGLAGCAATHGDAVAPSPAVVALVEDNRTYPRWEDFPATPTDLPAASVVAAQVATLDVTGGALAGEVSRLEWTLSDPDAYVAAVMARIEAARIAPATARTRAEIDALADELRARGRAPPPIPRR